MGGQGGRRGTYRVLRALLLGVLVLAAAPAASQAQIVVQDARATESAGSLTFTITRQAGLAAPAVTIAFSAQDASAVAPADFLAVSGTRTFPFSLLGGSQHVTVTVPVTRDALDEDDETLRLVISGSGVSDGEGIGTIEDDDAAPALSVGDATPAAEGASAAFTIALSKASGRAVSVTYATVDGSATAAQDYDARSARVTIPAGSTTAAVAVPLTDDTVDEPNETFGLRLGAPTAATLGSAAATATIVDNDEPAPPPTPPVSTPGSGQPPPATGSVDPGALPMLGVSSPRLRQPATVVVTIACPRQAGRCSGRLTIFSRPHRRSRLKDLRIERRLGRRNFNLPGGGAGTLLVALSRRDRVLLRRAGRIDVRAYIVTTDSSGRTGVRRVNGTLVARTSHSG
ncbi:MAG TPA: Calx-beta domain-containing protein [Solirubrobacteraceae bacterium]|nr:Calx-beta domain-containing protein [Solirubrobacteraceae bacterium]